MRQILFIIISLALVAVLVYWKFGPSLFNKEEDPNRPITLTVYGLWEEESLFNTLAAEYTKVHPNVIIKYSTQNSLNYRSRVQTQISENQGPDIFLVHNTWIPMFANSGFLSATPPSIMSVQEFQQTFYPVAAETLIQSGNVYAIPLEIDGLVMYYNEDLVKFANITPSDNWTWDQFREAALKLTVPPNSDQKLQTAGAAIGSTKNVEHWSDLIGLLYYQQPEANILDPGTSKGKEVIDFYNSFVRNQDSRVWADDMEPAIEAFSTGRVGFYFGPSWRAHDIKSKNPNLKFRTVTVPQLPGGNVAWGSFWAYSVSSRSKEPSVAWDFLKFLSSQEMQRKYYDLASQVRGFGQPYARVDLAGEIKDHPVAGAFVRQGPIYKSWYLSSDTFDAAINDQVIQLFKGVVDSGGSEEKMNEARTGTIKALNDFRAN